MSANIDLSTIYRGLRNPSKAARHIHEKIRNYQWEKASSEVHPIKNVSGFKLHLNSHDRGISKPLFLDGEFAPAETRFYSKFVEEEMIIADIGANIGYFSLQFAEKSQDGNIYAFEPEPLNFKLLYKNVCENGFENITVEQMAISSSVGEMKLYKHPKNGGGHSLHKDGVLPFDEFPTDGDTDKVKTTTFDSYFGGDNKPTPDFVKIDVEGGEPGVFMGMVKSLHTAPILSFEYTPHMWITDPAETFEFLKSYDYEFHEITREGSLRPRTIEDLLNYNDGWYDIVAVADEKDLP